LIASLRSARKTHTPLLKQPHSQTRCLSVYIACSLAFHCVLLFTSNTSPWDVADTSRQNTFRLQVSLNTKVPTSASTNKRVYSTPIPVANTAQPKKSPPISNKASSTLTPLTAPLASEPETYIDPQHVDEIAFAIAVPELPLPTDEETLSGTLQIKIFINTTGIPAEIEIVQNTLPEHYVASLTNAFSKARFQPALLGGVPVNSWRTIEITYGNSEPSPLDEGEKREH